MPGNLYLQHLTAGLHLAGADGATSFPDVKGHSFYRTGAVAISTAQSRFAGEGSAYFPGGTSDLLKCNAHADFGPANGSLAIAFSIYPLSLPPSGVTLRLIMIGVNGSSGSIVVSVTNAGNMGCYVPLGGLNSVFSAPGVVTLNEWQDYEVAVFDGACTILKNGVRVASLFGLDMPVAGGTKRVQIGGDNSGFSSVDARYHGYFSELQIQVGSGRMPSGASPTGPFSEALEIGTAAAVGAPLAAIRSAPPAHRILRQGAPALLRDIEHGGRGQVVGTTKNIGTPNYPVSRRVRLLRKRDGLLAREGWSDAGGNYEFMNVRHDIEYVVMSHDHTGLYNAVVADTVTPELMP